MPREHGLPRREAGPLSAGAVGQERRRAATLLRLLLTSSTHAQAFTRQQPHTRTHRGAVRLITVHSTTLQSTHSHLLLAMRRHRRRAAQQRRGSTQRATGARQVGRPHVSGCIDLLIGDKRVHAVQQRRRAVVILIAIHGVVEHTGVKAVVAARVRLQAGHHARVERAQKRVLHRQLQLTGRTQRGGLRLALLQRGHLTCGLQ